MANYNPDKIYWIRDGVVESRYYERGRIYTQIEARKEAAAGLITLPVFVYESGPGTGHWWWADCKEDNLIQTIRECDMPPSILLYRLLEDGNGNG